MTDPLYRRLQSLEGEQNRVQSAGSFAGALARTFIEGQGSRKSRERAELETAKAADLLIANYEKLTAGSLSQKDREKIEGHLDSAERYWK